jgi:hypothetical protein
MEQWKDIVGFEGLYQVSNQGKVKSLEKQSYDGRVLPEKLLKRRINPQGYDIASIRKNNKQYYKPVHRLMMEAFKGPSPLMVDHLDGVRDNNILENLEYVTNRENCIRGKNCLKKKNKSSKYVGVKKTVDGTFQARINIKGKVTHLGTFKDELMAHQAYMNAKMKVD